MVTNRAMVVKGKREFQVSSVKYGKASCREDNEAAGMEQRLGRHPGAHLPTKYFYC